jgi:hypothetical protein
MGAVIGFLLGRTLFRSPFARKGLAFAAVLIAVSFCYSHAVVLTNAYNGSKLVAILFSIAIVLGLITRASSKLVLTRFRGDFLSYSERVSHGKAPHVPAGVPA